MESVFEQFSSILEEETKTREDIKQVTRELDRICRQMLAHLQQVHGKILQAKDICNKTKEFTPQVKEQFQKIQTLVKPEFFYKYHDHWKYHVQQLVFILSFVHWIETNELASIEQIEASIGVPGKSESNPNSFGIELEDYLLGLTNLPNELSRLCINSVTASDFKTPLKISQFVSELYSGFRLLNLKNDALRKRYDSIKYDLKKIEEVVYDISIRKLVPAEEQPSV